MRRRVTHPDCAGCLIGVSGPEPTIIRDAANGRSWSFTTLGPRQRWSNSIAEGRRPVEAPQVSPVKNRIYPRPKLSNTDSFSRTY